MPVLGSTLHHYKQSWIDIGASDFVLSLISNGVQIKLESYPECFHLPNRHMKEKHELFIRSELQVLEQAGYISAVCEPPYCVSPIYCVPKNDG